MGLSVDTSDLETHINMLRTLLTREQMEKLLHRTFGEVGRKAKTIIAKEGAREYAVTQKWMRDGVKRYQLTYGGTAPVTCKIPVQGVKGSIGGLFHANTLKQKKVAGRISARIVKGSTSRLPAVMKNQGGNPPFLVQNSTTRSGMNGMAFTRRTKKRLPVVRVVALASPQPPVNRSQNEVADQLLDYAGERLEHNFNYMLSTGFKT